MRIVRIAIRGLVIVVLLLLGILLTLLVSFSNQKIPPSWAKQLWSRLACRAAGIKVELRGVFPSRCHLLLSNHISFVDVLVLSSQQPSYFLSKAEVAKWPVVGWMVRKNGTLFIQRGQGMKQAVTDIADRLKVGSTVTFFPEATTTSGLNIRRYFPHILDAAVQADVPIQPVLLAYVKQDAAGELVCDEEIAYIDDRTMVGIVLDMLGNKNTQVVVTVLEPINPAKHSIKAIAKLAQAETAAAQSELYQNRYDEVEPEEVEIVRN